MSPTTLHRFNELPKELQLQIWEHAATFTDGNNGNRVSGAFENGRLIFKALQDGYLKTGSSIRNVYPDFMRTLNYWNLFCTRRALMLTYRSARLVAMKVWKMEVMAIQFDKGRTVYIENLKKVQSELELACKLEVVKLRWRMGT